MPSPTFTPHGLPTVRQVPHLQLNQNLPLKVCWKKVNQWPSRGYLWTSDGRWTYRDPELFVMSSKRRPGCWAGSTTGRDRTPHPGESRPVPCGSWSDTPAYSAVDPEWFQCCTTGKRWFVHSISTPLLFWKIKLHRLIKIVQSGGKKIPVADPEVGDKKCMYPPTLL